MILEEGQALRQSHALSPDGDRMKRIFSDRDAIQRRHDDQAWALALALAVLYLPVACILLWYVWSA